MFAGVLATPLVYVFYKRSSSNFDARIKIKVYKVAFTDGPSYSQTSLYTLHQNPLCKKREDNHCVKGLRIQIVLVRIFLHSE